jgi:hypothetical protein
MLVVSYGIPALFYGRALEGTMKMSKKEGMAVLLAAIVSTFGAAGASADAIYSYTGNDFTTVTPSPPLSSVYTTSDFVSLTLTLTAPLQDNLNLASIIPEVVSFTISDGVVSYDLAEFPRTLMQAPILQFSTNATGDITNWAVRLIAAPSISGSIIQTFNTPTQIFDQAQVALFCLSGCTGSNTNSPGIWTTVPGPTMGAGIPGLVAACGGLLVWWRIRRRRASDYFTLRQCVHHR